MLLMWLPRFGRSVAQIEGDDEDEDDVERGAHRGRGETANDGCALAEHRIEKTQQLLGAIRSQGMMVGSMTNGPMPMGSVRLTNEVIVAPTSSINSGVRSIRLATCW